MASGGYREKRPTVRLVVAGIALAFVAWVSHARTHSENAAKESNVPMSPARPFYEDFF
jgi:hypothetical protein